jgi:hypothetical protein
LQQLEGSGFSDRKEVKRVAKERKKQQDVNKNGSPTCHPFKTTNGCHQIEDHGGFAHAQRG